MNPEQIRYVIRESLREGKSNDEIGAMLADQATYGDMVAALIEGNCAMKRYRVGSVEFDTYEEAWEASEVLAFRPFVEKLDGDVWREVVDSDPETTLSGHFGRSLANAPRVNPCAEGHDFSYAVFPAGKCRRCGAHD